MATYLERYQRVFDAPDLTLEDRTAACLVAERAVMATLTGLHNAEVAQPPTD